MSKAGVHHSTPNSKAGRRMIRVGSDFNPNAVSPEIQDWNAQVEQRKRGKLERKLSKTVNQPRDPVHYHAGKWWFWSETWDNAEGPYDMEFQARQGLEAYGKMLDGPIIDCNESCSIP